MLGSTSSPIQTLTVGPGFSPGQPIDEVQSAHGLRTNVHYRRSGIAPCPEDGIDILLSITIIHTIRNFEKGFV
jgi:hypothetical protein